MLSAKLFTNTMQNAVQQDWSGENLSAVGRLGFTPAHCVNCLVHGPVLCGMSMRCVQRCSLTEQHDYLAQQYHTLAEQQCHHAASGSMLSETFTLLGLKGNRHRSITGSNSHSLIRQSHALGDVCIPSSLTFLWLPCGGFGPLKK